MRITIGGVLIMGGIATAAAWAPLSKSAGFFGNAIGSVKGLINSVSEPMPTIAPPTPAVAPAEPAVDAAAPNPVEDPNSSSSAPPEPAVVAQPEAEPVAVAETPAPVEKVVPAVAEKKVSPRRRRRVRKAKPTAKAPVGNAATAKAAPAEVKDGLTGKYVSIKLKSGREVKGILLNRTDSAATLEIPGMGPFQYPDSNIEAVTAAE